MIVNTFSQSCSDYENFAIWDIENMRDFFDRSTVLNEIFEHDYKTTYPEYDKNRTETSDTNLEIMSKLLDQIGDKHFFIFTLHDENHLELVGLQQSKIMNFGMDIQEIKGDRVYVVMMDKKKKGAFA